MTDLAAFLHARITEDEQAARAATHDDRWEWTPEDMTEADLILQLGTVDDESGTSACVACFYGMDHIKSHPPEQADADHVVRWDPARVLAECDAKRQIIELHNLDEHLCWSNNEGVGYSAVSGSESVSYGNGPWIKKAGCQTLRCLALPYADHPDYREEWRP